MTNSNYFYVKRPMAVPLAVNECWCETAIPKVPPLLIIISCMPHYLHASPTARMPRTHNLLNVLMPQSEFDVELDSITVYLCTLNRRPQLNEKHQLRGHAQAANH
jgi:hypothetical protein